MSLVETERVLVIPTEVFHRLGHFQGFSTDINRYLDEVLDPQHASYRPRSEMETDPSFKQLIPYVVFRYQNEDGQICLFQYTRGSGQGEKRLHSKVSIGIGGHISSVDRDSQGDTYTEGMRELEEEVDVRTEFSERIVGLINDDETDVGRVHLGIVHIADVVDPQVFPREDDIQACGFQTLAELAERRESMESWSRICFDGLFGENGVFSAE